MYYSIFAKYIDAKIVIVCLPPIHSRTHTGEKPYEYSQSDKNFAKTNLKTHTRAHTSQKP